MTVGRPSPTVEDYLQLIYDMNREGRSVIAARVAEKVNAAAPTVWGTLRRMQRDGLVQVHPRRGIALTAKGTEAAESIMRRHRLTERLLTDLLGLDWAEAHEEAHLIEHAISPRVEERIMAVLGNPTTCPHGNPLPGVTPRATTPLSSASEGDHLLIDGINEEAEEDSDLMRFYQRHGLVPGGELNVVEVAPFNSTITVEPVGGDQVTLGLPAARQLRVYPASASGRRDGVGRGSRSAAAGRRPRASLTK